MQSIPAASATEPPVAAGSVPPVPPSAQGSPFANPNVGTGYADSTNPYAAPSFDPSIAPYAAGGEFRPTRIDVGTVFSRAWEIFWANAGVVILGWFISQIIVFGLQMVLNILVAAAQASGVDPAVVAILNVTTSFGANLLFLWISLGISIYFLKVARGQPAKLGDLFSASPGHWVTMLVVSIILIVGFAIVAALVMAPGAILLAVDSTLGVIGLVVGALILVPFYLFWFVTFFVSPFLVVDRNPGIADTIRLLFGITRGNRFALILAALLNVAIMFIGFLALCVGAIVAIPLTYMVWTVAYLMMTGQRVATKQPTAY